MKKLTVWAFVALLTLVSLTACVPPAGTQPVTTPDLSQFSATFEGVCNVWRTIRDRYPKLRESAILLRELGGVDDKTWEAFVWIDTNAKQLDTWLALVCDAEAGVANAHVIAREKAGVDWDQVGSVVLKVAGFALKSGLL